MVGSDDVDGAVDKPFAKRESVLGPSKWRVHFVDRVVASNQVLGEH